MRQTGELRERSIFQAGAHHKAATKSTKPAKKLAVYPPLLNLTLNVSCYREHLHRPVANRTSSQKNRKSTAELVQQYSVVLPNNMLLLR
jgi:hypothetical protein